MLPVLFAQTSARLAEPRLLMGLASLTMGLAAAWLAWVVARVVWRPLPSGLQAWNFEQARRSKLREHSRIYRWFEPLIEELGRVRLLHALGSLPKVRRALDAGGTAVPWTAEEFIGLVTFQGLAVALTVLWLTLKVFAPSTAVVLAAVTLVWFVRRGVRTLVRSAQNRLKRLKRRLPFGVDLLALMMEAGASFRESLATVAHECRDHPLGEELGTIQQSLSRGQTLREALDRMQQRLHDEDVKEMATAITRAEDLGTPLSKVFLTLADQMRLKRVQWAEKAAGEAQTMITFPGMVVMLACLLAVVAPFLLTAYADLKGQ